jgi:hypothetical protein
MHHTHHHHPYHLPIHRDVPEHAKESEQRTQPLIHHPKDKHEAAEWRAVTDENRASIESGKNQPHPVKLADVQRDKQIEKDKDSVAHAHSNEEKLAAAHELARYGVYSFSIKDAHGLVHDYAIKDLGNGRLKVTDGDRKMAEDPKSGTNHIGVPHVQGFRKHLFGSGGTYQQPRWRDGRAHQIYSPHVDPRFYQITENPDGSRTINFVGCAVDTDGASYHPEDANWQGQTKLARSDGKPLNTDLDNFVVLSPSQARALGVKQGDRGYLVDLSRGSDGKHPAVPVVIGDEGPEGKRTAEASVHSIKQLGYQHIDGNNGVDGRRFQIVVYPHTGNGNGDIARHPDAIKAQLDAMAVGRSGPLG